MPDQETINESWRLVLDDLEVDLARVQSGTFADRGERLSSADWSPPSVAGPMPEEYANHVRELIERQRDAVLRLDEARRVTGEHLGALRAASASTGDSVYLDVEG